MLVSGPADGTGTVKLNADGSFEFVPAPDFVGAATFAYRDSFTFKSADADSSPTETLLSNVATVTINVKPITPAPVANNDYYSVVQDTTLTIAAPGVLKNDVPVTNYPLVSMIDHGPAHGTLTLNGDGGFSYQPTPGYTGLDTFMYFDTETYVPPRNDGDPISDPIQLHSNTATVTISVQPLHPPVFAFDDYYKTTIGTAITIAAPGVLANDTLIPPPLPLAPGSDAALTTTSDGVSHPVPIPYPNTGYTITAKQLSDVSHGTLTFNADGSFTYKPDATFTGAVSFTYQASASPNGTTAGSMAASANSATDLNMPCVIGGPCPTPPDDIATVTIYVKARAAAGAGGCE